MMVIDLVFYFSSSVVDQLKFQINGKLEIHWFHKLINLSPGFSLFHIEIGTSNYNAAPESNIQCSCHFCKFCARCGQNIYGKQIFLCLHNILHFTNALIFLHLHNILHFTEVLIYCCQVDECCLMFHRSTNIMAMFVRGHHGPDRIVVGITTTCAITKVVSSNPVYDKMYSIQHYVIKLVSDLR